MALAEQMQADLFVATELLATGKLKGGRGNLHYRTANGEYRRDVPVGCKCSVCVVENEKCEVPLRYSDPGWLCRDCMFALGYLHDSLTIAEAMVNFLRIRERE